MMLSVAAVCYLAYLAVQLAVGTGISGWFYNTGCAGASWFMLTQYIDIFDIM